MTVHELVGGDPHLISVGRRKYCNCLGDCCFNSVTADCTCDECDCGTDDMWCPPIADVVDVPLPEKPVEVPAHICQDCGVEVFRNGTRGRFPSRCPECKEKV